MTKPFSCTDRKHPSPRKRHSPALPEAKAGRIRDGFLQLFFLLALGGCSGGDDAINPAARPAYDGAGAWPGDAAVRYVDDPAAALGGNTSGLAYQPATATEPGYLWVVKNGPPELHRLVFDAVAGRWRRQAVWDLTTPDGESPDTEAVTGADWSGPLVYVGSERENNGGSKPTVIAWDTARGAAAYQWNLIHDEANPESLPVEAGSNSGIEALSWIPDEDLLRNGFYDERLKKSYDPQDYPGHGTGLFVAGLEMNGQLYFYALDQESGNFYRLATVESGFPFVMGLEYDRDTGYLWAHCDDTCGNLTAILGIDTESASPTRGRFVHRSTLHRPDALRNSNHEGIAILPASECVAGARQFIWADDASNPGRSLSAGTVPCGAFLPDAM